MHGACGGGCEVREGEVCIDAKGEWIVPFEKKYDVSKRKMAVACKAAESTGLAAVQWAARTTKGFINLPEI